MSDFPGGYKITVSGGDPDKARKVEAWLAMLMEEMLKHPKLQEQLLDEAARAAMKENLRHCTDKWSILSEILRGQDDE